MRLKDRKAERLDRAPSQGNSGVSPKDPCRVIQRGLGISPT